MDIIYNIKRLIFNRDLQICTSCRGIEGKHWEDCKND